MEKYLSYLRVSTSKQGVDGLGIDAQRSSVSAYMGDGELLHEYVEVESGKRDDRPQLEAALQHAKATGATLLCAKLDRIGRKASHVLSLLDDSGVDVVFADNPTANSLTLGVLAVVAQEEARAISERTKAGLAAARARGTKLGGPLGAKPLTDYIAVHGNKAGIAGAKKAADEFAAGLKFAVERIVQEGTVTAKGIADELNRSGFPSRRGGKWHAASVQRILKRLDIDTSKLPVDGYSEAA